MNTYNVIGLMSGSSLDGLDIAYCRFEEDNGNWSYKIIEAECIPYQPKWKLRLENLVMQNAITYLKTHTFFGHYLGELVREFMIKHQLKGKVDFIASHGQTIFHQPENHLTSQIGDGAALAAVTKVPVICDFRTMDVALGGQGAPIVPIGEKLLFPGYTFYLNIGGIANISAKITEDKYVAFDICTANTALNHLAAERELDLDKDGEMARSGNIDKELLDELNNNWYFQKEYPKSLSGGWITKVVFPILKRFRSSTEDKLRTVCEHIAMQVTKDIKLICNTEGIPKDSKYKMLVTGGGGFNTFLMERIKALAPIQIIVPDDETVKFKEAIIIGLMGVLRIRKEINVLSSVTGAKEDNIGGVIYQTPERK